jgi:transposase
VVVAAVPWARHGAWHTRAFDDVAAWCAVEMSGSAASRLLRCSWRMIGVIVARVGADLRAGQDGLAGLRRIGIDEISYRRHHRYLLEVLDHDRKRLVHAVDGANKTNLRAFFDALGPDRTAQLTHIGGDGAPWLSEVVAERAPRATLCADPFHVVRWAWTSRRGAPRDLAAGAHRSGRNRPAVGEGKRLKTPAGVVEEARTRSARPTNSDCTGRGPSRRGCAPSFSCPPATEALPSWLRGPGAAAPLVRESGPPDP